MGIRQWHPGKLVMLWLAAGFLLYLALRASGHAYTNDQKDLALLLLLLAVPFAITVSVITWKWFGGREKDTNDFNRPGKG
jgi:cytochrome c biogenesis factor